MLTPREGQPSYPDLVVRATRGKLFDTQIMIASREDLIAMKEHAIAELETDIRKHEDDINRLRNGGV